MLHSDCCQFGAIQQLNIRATMCRLSGISELLPLRWHPESVPAMPMCVPPLGLSTSCGVVGLRLLLVAVKKTPHQIVREPMGSRYDKSSVVRYEP